MSISAVKCLALDPYVFSSVSFYVLDLYVYFNSQLLCIGFLCLFQQSVVMFWISMFISTVNCYVFGFLCLFQQSIVMFWISMFISTVNCLVHE